MPSLRFTCTYKPRKEGGRGSKMVLLLEARFSIVLSPEVERKESVHVFALVCAVHCCTLCGASVARIHRTLQHVFSCTVYQCM